MITGEVDVETPLRLLTDSATTPITSRLRFRVEDPYEVRLVIVGSGQVEWAFARDLLRAGLVEAAGLGDVQIWPAETAGQVFLRLSSPAGEAVFAADAAHLRGFLTRTEALVPSGEESRWLALDERLAALFGSDESGPAFGWAGDVV